MKTGASALTQKRHSSSRHQLERILAGDFLVATEFQPALRFAVSALYTVLRAAIMTYATAISAFVYYGSGSVSAGSGAAKKGYAKPAQRGVTMIYGHTYAHARLPRAELCRPNG